MSEQTDQEHGPVPFAWGDRVDHPKFGIGTVVSQPVPASGPIADRSVAGGYRIGPKGWSIEVEWDDPNRSRRKFSSSHFSLVERPDAKGGAYWSAIHRERLENVLDARCRTNNSMQQAFRNPNGGPDEVRAKLETERTAINELLAFLDADGAGEHR